MKSERELFQLLFVINHLNKIKENLLHFRELENLRNGVLSCIAEYTLFNYIIVYVGKNVAISQQRPTTNIKSIWFVLNL